MEEVDCASKVTTRDCLASSASSSSSFSFVFPSTLTWWTSTCWSSSSSSSSYMTHENLVALSVDLWPSITQATCCCCCCCCNALVVAILRLWVALLARWLALSAQPPSESNRWAQGNIALPSPLRSPSPSRLTCLACFALLASTAVGDVASDKATLLARTTKFSWTCNEIDNSNYNNNNNIDDNVLSCNFLAVFSRLAATVVAIAAR